MRIDFPELFSDVVGESVRDSNSGSNSLLVGESCSDPNSAPKNSGRSPNPFLEAQGIFFIKTHIYPL